MSQPKLEDSVATGLRWLAENNGLRSKRPRRAGDIINMRQNESPIEEFMGDALNRIAWPEGVEVKQQINVGRYRVDFMVGRRLPSGRADCLIAVECDGSRYHDANADAKRDRFVQMAGAAILRFTSAEIRENVQACASEVQEFMEMLIRRSAK